jgi:hypothetical protein
MKRIFVPTRSAEDWQRLLAKPDLHWKPGASAMTAAACWEGANGGLPPEIRMLLNETKQPGLLDCEMLIAFPEWEVALPGGNTSSHTDVLAVCRNSHGLCVIGVEAKVLEDFGPLVGEKRKQSSAGQRERLGFLHRELGVDHFEDGIRYQLLHRTASALISARQFHASSAVMLIHAFDCPADRKADFLAFSQAMNGRMVSPDVFRVERNGNPSLFLAWCNGDCSYRQADLRQL